MPELLNIASIRLDGGTQPRAALFQNVIDDYAESMKAGVEMPPVDVFFDGAEYWLADGFHRHAANKKAGNKGISAEIHQGTRRDAKLFSVGANALHGLRRTNDDKRRAVTVLLTDEEWAKWADRKIARHAAVTQPFVSGLRKALSDNGYQIPTARKVERGGTVYEQKARTATEPEPQEPEVRPSSEAPALTGDAVLEAAKGERQTRAAARKAANDNVARREVVLPHGKFGTIVIDPPWDMQKIERDVRPNQVAFDYPTMNEQQLVEFDAVVNEAAAPDCHMFLWTTQKYLPMALRLLDAWQFKYVLTMVWHKPGGPQPFGLPQYNCEFAIYARKGSPEFVDLTAFSACFNAPRKEHSRKPDEFYDLVRRVTAPGRIDIFSREKRDGFEQYGNEIEKFSEAA